MCGFSGDIHSFMEKKLYEQIAEILKKNGLISDSEYRYISRLIQKDFKGSVNRVLKGDD